MKRILAAVDFTDATKTVLDAATSLAECMKGELNILHATEPVLESIGYRGGPESIGDGIVEVKQDTHELNSICDSLTAKGLKAQCSQLPRAGFRYFGVQGMACGLVGVVQ